MNETTKHVAIEPVGASKVLFEQMAISRVFGKTRALQSLGQREKRQVKRLKANRAAKLARKRNRRAR